jgi:hypothetical protein
MAGPENQGTCLNIYDREEKEADPISDFHAGWIVHSGKIPVG